MSNLIKNKPIKLFLYLLVLLTGIILSAQFTFKQSSDVMYSRENKLSTYPPKNWDAYLAVYDHHLDHEILYHNFYGSIDNVKNSDILILGNSQSLFGLHYESTLDFMNKYNVKVFNMAFGHDENYMFPLKIIKNHKLKPKIILIDSWLLRRDTLSDYGYRVVNNGKFQAFKNILEYSLSSKLENFIKKHFRRLNFGVKDKTKAEVYRSKEHGYYYLDNISIHNNVAIDTESKNPFQPDIYKTNESQTKVANKFLSSIKETGAKIIFFSVPGRGHIPYYPYQYSMSKKLGVEFLDTSMKEVYVFDGRHLAHQSAVKFTNLLFKKLETSKSFTEIFHKQQIKER